MNATTGQGFEGGRQVLGGGVDGIGAHHIAYVIDDVHHQERANSRVSNHPHFQVARATAQVLQHQVNIIQPREQFSFVRQDEVARLQGISQVEQLHLPDHLGGCAAGLESAVSLCQFSHE